jgi:hypothetical protein
MREAAGKSTGMNTAAESSVTGKSAAMPSHPSTVLGESAFSGDHQSVAAMPATNRMIFLMFNSNTSHYAPSRGELLKRHRRHNLRPNEGRASRGRSRHKNNSLTPLRLQVRWSDKSRYSLPRHLSIRMDATWQLGAWS